jgi:hypothetical protein
MVPPSPAMSVVIHGIQRNSRLSISQSELDVGSGDPPQLATSRQPDDHLQWEEAATMPTWGYNYGQKIQLHISCTWVTIMVNPELVTPLD